MPDNQVPRSLAAPSALLCGPEGQPEAAVQPARTAVGPDPLLRLTWFSRQPCVVCGDFLLPHADQGGQGTLDLDSWIWTQLCDTKATHGPLLSGRSPWNQSLYICPPGHLLQDHGPLKGPSWSTLGESEEDLEEAAMRLKLLNVEAGVGRDGSSVCILHRAHRPVSCQ